MEARRWLALARDDRRTIELCLNAAPPVLSAALLHTQQMAEKLIKGALVLHARPFRKTHDLHELVATLAEVQPDLATLAAPLADLTPWHLLGRYPGPFGFEELPGACDIHAVLPTLDDLAARLDQLSITD